MKVLLRFCFFLILGLACCTLGGNPEISTSDARSILLAHRAAGDSLSFSSYRKGTSVEALIGIYKGKDSATIRVFKRNAPGISWNLATSRGLEKAGDLNKTDWVSVEGKELLYVDYAARDTTARQGEIFFDLFDPVEGRFYGLAYAYNTVKHQTTGGFLKATIDTLRKSPDLLNFLQRRAQASDLIPSWDNKTYVPGNNEAIRKWAMLNEGVYGSLNDAQNKDLRLNIEEYATDITPLGALDSTLLAQNNLYKVVGANNGPVYVLNKQNKHSFVIWAPPDSNSRITKLALRNTLLSVFPKISDTLVTPYSVDIDLVQKTVKKTLLVSHTRATARLVVKRKAVNNPRKVVVGHQNKKVIKSIRPKSAAVGSHAKTRHKKR